MTLALVSVNFASSSLLATNLAGRPLGSVIDEFVVVDNPSTEEESRRVGALCTENGWHLVELASNEGFGAGVNTGIARARELGCSHALVLNPDARIDPESVRRLLAASAVDPTALVGPRILRSDGRVWFSGQVLDPRSGRTRRAREEELEGDRTWQTGACFLVALAMWDEVGGFDDDYFMYWEDIDLSWRWRHAGGRLILVDDATAIHDVGGTQDGVGKSPLYVYYNCRNRLLFARKRLASRNGARWWPGAPAYAWSVATRGSRRELARHPLLLWSAIRGTIAGAFGSDVPRGGARTPPRVTAYDVRPS